MAYLEYENEAADVESGSSEFGPTDPKKIADVLDEVYQGSGSDLEGTFTPGEVAKTWHGARDDAEASGDLKRGSLPGSRGLGGHGLLDGGNPFGGDF